jgi:hypothetical protein
MMTGPSDEVVIRACRAMGIPVGDNSDMSVGRRRKIKQVLEEVWPWIRQDIAEEIADALQREGEGWGAAMGDDAPWIREHFAVSDGSPG